MSHHPRTMLGLVVLAILASPLLGVAGASTRAQDANVAGDWVLTVETPNGAQPVNVTLTQEEGAVEGTIELPTGPEPLTGTVEGNELAFTVTIDTPNGAFSINFTGTVEENKKISGTVDSSGGEISAPFTGEKKEQD